MSDKEWAIWREEMRRKGITPKPRVGPKIEDDEYQAVEAEALDLGGRCQIQPGDRRGVIRCILETPCSFRSANLLSVHELKTCLDVLHCEHLLPMMVLLCSTFDRVRGQNLAVNSFCRPQILRQSLKQVGRDKV